MNSFETNGDKLTSLYNFHKVVREGHYVKVFITEADELTDGLQFDAAWWDAIYDKDSKRDCKHCMFICESVGCKTVGKYTVYHCKEGHERCKRLASLKNKGGGKHEGFKYTRV